MSERRRWRVHAWMRRPPAPVLPWAADGLGAAEEAHRAHHELNNALEEVGINLPVVTDDTVRQAPVIDMGKCLPHIALKPARRLREGSHQ